MSDTSIKKMMSCIERSVTIILQTIYQIYTTIDKQKKNSYHTFHTKQDRILCKYFFIILLVQY